VQLSFDDFILSIVTPFLDLMGIICAPKSFLSRHTFSFISGTTMNFFSCIFLFHRDGDIGENEKINQVAHRASCLPSSLVIERVEEITLSVRCCTLQQYTSIVPFFKTISTIFREQKDANTHLCTRALVSSFL
jgi:hypothetical protein